MEVINFNRNWHFKQGNNVGDESGVRQNYDLIGLPHSFGIPYYGEDTFYVGYGCYYKTFDLHFNKHDKILLEFGAVFQVAEIYINKKYVCTHSGGYTMFSIDISDYVENGKNDLFVRVNNLWSETIAPRAGEHVFNGGIYRDVNLIIYPNSHIDWNGVKISTSKIAENRYKINIKTKVVNAVGKLLTSSIIDNNGDVVAVTENAVGTNLIEQEIELNRPHLWSIDKPYLYTLRSKLGEDSLETTFGIRTIEWRSEDGFFLNDRHVLLEGVNVHQDRGGWADASTHAGIYRDIKLMKDAGFNFIRGAHYPHHTEFAKECDRQGMLFWSEGTFWGIGAFIQDGYWNSSAMPVRQKDFEPFEKNLKQQLYEMINSNYNSPSIICWSIGNEMFFSKKEVIKDMKELVQRLVDYCHQLDPTRPVAIGGAHREDMDKLGDIAGYNGDGAIIFKNPGVPNVLTSYGSIPSYRPGRVDLYETKGSDVHYSWRAGRALWCGFHHGSISSIGNLGICDLYRLPLNAYYAYRNKNMNEPIPKPAVRDKVKRLELVADKNYLKGDGTDDVMITCTLVNNRGERVCYDGEVRLEVVSGPLLLPTGKTMTFSSKLKNLFDGMFQIEARGYYSGKSLVLAKMGDVVSSMLIVEVLADEDYTNQDIVYMPLPANKERPKSPYTDIIENKPVFVSSEVISGSCRCLTSTYSKYWSPQKTDSQPYLLIDFQQFYDRYTIYVKAKLFSQLAMKISTSIDGRDWIDLGVTDKRRITINNRARYIKIRVNKKAKIKRIKIFER